MATKASTKAKRATERKAKRVSPSQDKAASAVALLKADHREVEGFFEQFESAKGKAEKAELARKICTALKVHTQVEEELFYPAARKATKDDDLLDEAAVEHDGAKYLIEQIEAMQPGDELYDAKVKVLSEQIHHHVEEEENELFPEAEASKLDLDALGKEMAELKQTLMGETQPASKLRKAS